MRDWRTLAPALLVWAVAGSILAAATARVVDWYVMTDELLYERLALSVVRTGSPLPAVHGDLVPNVSQLYPLLLATVFHGGLVPDALRDAHVLNAFVMTSAAIPAALIARSAFGSAWAAVASAALAVVLPWLVLASFLLTEVAAYPLSLWAVYASQCALTRGGARRDVLALAAVALATLARAQLAVLVVVLPLAALLRARPRLVWERHRTYLVVLAAGAAALVVLALAGRASSVLGTYSSTLEGEVVPSGSARGFAQHVAGISIGLGFLPVLLGCAWLVRHLRRNDYAAVALVAVTLLTLEVTFFDLRFGGGIVRDRYLFYVAPLLLVAFLGALLDPRLPRWELAPGAVLVLVGLLDVPLPRFERLNVDTPVAASYDAVGTSRTTLLVYAALLLVVFMLARRLLPQRLVAAVFAVAAVAAYGGETAHAFDRLFRANGTSGRPVTLDQGVVFDWIDRAAGRDASVTMIPYAQVAGDYWASVGYWWDVEFWNVSVDRAAYLPKRYEGTPSTFPKTYLTIDPRTGRVSPSPSRYAAESDYESRFRLRGPTVSLTRDVRLIDAGSAWQLDWLSRGLAQDGWTVPGRTAVLRVYPAPGQTEALSRTVTFQLGAQNADRTVTFASNAGTWSLHVPGDGDASQAVTVCVPPHGFGEIRFRVRGHAPVYGDVSSRESVDRPREGGALLRRASLADELGGPCDPRR